MRTIERKFDVDAAEATCEAGIACQAGRCECCGISGVICTTQAGEIMAEDGTLVYVSDGRTILTVDSLGRGWMICDECDEQVRS